MLASIVAKLLGSVGFGFLDRVLGHIERKAASETERLKIEASRQAAANAEAAGVVKAGMQFPMFWVAWSIAAIPTVAWYGWGMIDSTLNGDLPDVAALPPQLKEYADVVFGNIFYSGAALGGAQVIASAIRGRK